MYRTLQITVTCVAMLIAAPGAIFGGIIESGDLNIIDDAGNPSDGLRYLDMTFSDGLSLADALANGQSSYSNARLATPGEWDDLFAAAGITYTAGLTAADAFTTGTSQVLSSGLAYDAGILSAQLGFTGPDPETTIWTDPDGNSGTGTTRDVVLFTATFVEASQFSAQPDGETEYGWLIVSDVAVVPEPSSLILMGIGAVGLLGYRLRRKSKRSHGTS